MKLYKLIAFTLWATVSLIVLALVSLPISLQTHLIAGAAVVAAMMVLKAIRPHGIWRLIALALGTSIVLRYVYWRTTSTLPPINQPQDFIPGLLVYCAEMYSVAMLALSLFVVAMPLPSRRQAGQFWASDAQTGMDPATEISAIKTGPKARNRFCRRE